MGLLDEWRKGILTIYVLGNGRTHLDTFFRARRLYILLIFNGRGQHTQPEVRNRITGIGLLYISMDLANLGIFFCLLLHQGQYLGSWSIYLYILAFVHYLPGTKGTGAGLFVLGRGWEGEGIGFGVGLRR